MAALVDTSVLVYLFDPRDRRKQRIAARVLEHGLKSDSLKIAHQAVLEFVAAVTRGRHGQAPLLSMADACREAEELVNQFEILYANEAVLRLALRGAAAYQLPWFDAHLWAYAEHYGLSELLSEDFEHGRLYGTVRAMNPFIR